MKQNFLTYYNNRFFAWLFVNAFSIQPNDIRSNGGGFRIDSEPRNSDGMDCISGIPFP